MAGENENIDSPKETRATEAQEPTGADKQAPEGEGKQEAEGEPRPPQTRGIDAKRAAIYEKARQRREEADGDGFKAYGSEDEERRVFGKNVQTSYDRDRSRQEADTPPAADEMADGAKREDTQAEMPAETRVRMQRLKVNGSEIELPEDQVVAYAQQAIAAGDILNQAKGMRSLLQKQLETLRDQQNQQSTQQTQTSAKPKGETTPADTDELDAIIDDIQVGDKSQAKEALNKYGTQLEQRIMQRLGNIDQRIVETTRLTQENERRRAESNQILKEFESEYPEFGKSQGMQMALFTETVGAMREQISNLGVQPETLDQLKQQHGLDDNTVVGFAYRQLQDRGYQLPDHGTMLRQSAKRLRDTMGLTQTQTPSADAALQADRLERKREMAPQPRRASVAPGQQSEPNIMESRRQAVQDMRRYRKGGGR